MKMKKYMVKVKIDDGTDEGQIVNWFYDDIHEADSARMDAECGMAWYAEMWKLVDGKYQFLYC